MAAPSGIVWGSIAGSYGRIGIYVSLSSTNTQTTRHTEIWFWSKYSVSDSSNTFYYDDNATSATTSKGSVSISTSVDSGDGWSTSNQVKLKEYDYTFDRGTSSSTRNVAAKLTDIDRVGAAMTATTSYTIPALASYTVSYNANGGSGAPSSQTKYYGKTLTLSSTKPTRSGYTFVGWGTSATDTTADYSAGGSYTANASDTLYAIWKKTITLTYDANGGSGAPSSQSTTIYNATTSYNFTLSSTKPTKTGYTFLGWSTSNTATSSSYSAGGTITLSSSDTLYAVWSENKLTVEYYSNYANYGTYKGEALSVSATTNVKVHSQDFYYDNSYSSALSNVQNPDYLYLSRSGYTPTGYWGTSESGGNLVDEDADYSTGQALAQALGKNISNGNVTVKVYPQWNINTYTITYNSNGGSGSMNSQTVEWQETFTLFDNTFKREGYKFIGWNAYRNDDSKWYVIGQGWLTEDEILTGGYEKKLYANQDELIFDMSWIRDNEEARTFTLYAIWEISGVVYIDNGTTFEPYLAYIDNGTSWDLYLMYIDNGTDWNIIS